ncbi:MAG: carbohydrate kinase family protein [Actinobacteria bacterium]|nr:carbohydrate kinase family protein [Actinomycetota bacterium]MBO0834626.1 carbohydrate kinase family protein [Actinomycetota bacterium]
MQICVIGDAHLDVVVGVAGPLAADTDTPATTHVGVGGQGANVAAWAAALGSKSRLIAALGTDLAARLIAEELAKRGVELVGPIVPGRTGVVVSMSDRGRQRSMLTDRGVGTELAAQGMAEDWLDGFDWLHVPAYSLTDGPVRETALAAVRAAAARSVRLSVDVSSTALIRAHGPCRFRRMLAALHPDVIFGTEEEAALLGDGVPAGRMVVKLGEAGVRFAGRHYPARPTVAVDATGAGDAFAAGYLIGGMELGLEAAARAVATMGAMP